MESLINNHYPGSGTGFFSETPSPTRVPPPRPPPPRNSRADEQETCTTSATPAPDSPRIYPKLSDFGSAEDLTMLSTKQLKELLTLNRVDYKGCIERSELLERATRLWNDNEKRKAGRNAFYFCVNSMYSLFFVFTQQPRMI